METVVGRKEETKILDHKLSTASPELIAVYGRRRVGKTYLIRTHLKEHIVFELAGIHEAKMDEQLKNFSLALGRAINSPAPIATAKTWIEAFYDLDKYLLDKIATKKPAVLFFDEFPWLHTHRSNFLRAFDHWWNSSGTKRANLKVVICGSAASWMIEKILNDRGGLHNRVTQTIRLLPFTLSETDAYLNYKGIQLDQYQTLQVYMAMGGIPYYLQHIVPGESAAQIIDRLCFTRNGPLRNEFKNLFESLFTHSDQHEKVIRALAQKAKGLTRGEIIIECELTTGGGTTKMLKELEESGFISTYIPFGKSVNESTYKLSDEYSLFYQKFIENAKATGEGTWLRQIQTHSYISWSGFAFESVCHKHSRQIKKALGIGDVLTEESSWRYLPSKGSRDKGAQIDLLLDRQDRTINVCEMKFAGDEFVIDKNYAEELDNKVNVFRRETGTKKALFLSMITTYGVRKNNYYTGRVMREVKMEDLFN
ncbi:ATP-binding protein [Flavihumibacter sp. CACIAM 22H1]|uniref:AAA family ATPase n=1 Tax=Flavihumibacter sp. CACIAM 22H1 TaxID=1812911 RepID=UPI0007A83DD6|nr:ATP-binding protein [Flavihumibacter sp. CACIAM 22H1]KYP16179.1 MAG: ATPase [Flavihumibacter sp. CACIAM 22H1]